MIGITIPLRYAARVVVSNVDKKSVDGELPVRLVNYTDVYYRSQIVPEHDYMAATATAEQIAKFQVQPGDSIITKDSESPADIAVSTYVARAEPDMVCGYHLALLRPTAAAEPKFLSWALASGFVQEQFANRANGMTRYGLTYDAIQSVSLPLPPLDEQRRIADFLDDQVTRIDAIIAAREAQARLLEEYVEGLAESLVWGGLTAHDREPTGVGPAPHAPAHWQRIRNRRVLSERVDLSETGTEELLTVSHLTGVTPRAEKSVNMFMAESLVGYKRVRSGDLVINTLWGWMGALGASSFDGIVSPAYGVYQPTDRTYLPGYFNLLYRSKPYVQEIARFSTGIWSSRLRIYPEAFLSLWTVVPPESDQLAIVAEVERVRSADLSRAQQLRRSIDLLNEYKRSLITAAVTGELDVTTTRVGVPA